MIARDLATLAFESLRLHRVRTGLTVAAIAIGVTAVLVLTAMGDAAKAFVVREFVNLGANLVIVSPGRTETQGMPAVAGGTRDITIEDAEAVRRRATAAKHVVPVSMGSAPFAWGGRVRTVLVAGTTAQLREVRRLQLAHGRFLPEGDPRHGSGVCVIGSKIQREVFRGENPLGQAVRIGDVRFRVIGVMAPRGRSLGIDFDDEAIVPVASALRLFNRQGLFHLFVQARDAPSTPRAIAQTRETLKERHDGEEDFTIVTQDAMMQTFGNVMDVLTVALAGIAAISLAVAGIGIMNVMLIAVAERSREVGLFKALGARRRQILRVFLAEALLLSAIGAAIGILLGLAGIGIGALLWPDIPIRPSPGWIAAVTALALAAGASFGLLPARRAARMEAAAALVGRR